MAITYFEEIKRKLIHLSSLWMVAATLLFPGKAAVILFAALLAGTLAVEHGYANRLPGIWQAYHALFGKMLRTPVQRGQWIVSGGAPVLAAALMVNLLFTPVVGAASLSVMLTGDAAAALIGRRFGRRKWVDGKSVEGTLAFVAVGSLASSVVLWCGGAEGVLWAALLPAVCAGAAAELFTSRLKVDDNFTIPFFSGCVWTFFAILAS